MCKELHSSNCKFSLRAIIYKKTCFDDNNLQNRDKEFEEKNISFLWIQQKCSLKSKFSRLVEKVIKWAKQKEKSKTKNQSRFFSFSGVLQQHHLRRRELRVLRDRGRGVGSRPHLAWTLRGPRPHDQYKVGLSALFGQGDLLSLAWNQGC